MIDKDAMYDDFKNDGMTPYEIHKKYKIHIEDVYQILKEKDSESRDK